MPVPIRSVLGAAIPTIGFGTSGLPSRCGEIVAAALACGYRHIDTARKYGSEEGVGEGIRASGLRRDDIFLVTKVSHENLAAADFARSVEQSLRALQVDYVDLLHVHWPNASVPLAETMTALAKAKRDGLARHLGVANFNNAMLDQAIRLCPEPLVTLQAEFHPFLDQRRLQSAVRGRGLAFTGYCPLGRGRLFDDDVLRTMAQEKGRTVAQIALRWSIQQGVIPIPRSAHPARIKENIAVFDFALTDAEMERISACARPGSRIADPAGRAPAWD